MRRLLVLIALFVLPAMADAAPVTPVTLQLYWKHQFQFAGYYAAIERGFYRDAGFDLTVRESQDGIDPIDMVISGGADYGVGSSSRFDAVADNRSWPWQQYCSIHLSSSSRSVAVLPCRNSSARRSC